SKTLPRTLICWCWDHGFMAGGSAATARVLSTKILALKPANGSAKIWNCLFLNTIEMARGNWTYQKRAYLFRAATNGIGLTSGRQKIQSKRHCIFAQMANYLSTRQKPAPATMNI